jgi:pyridinium-3,5-biscarboxylic acid mononucleotide synthase
MLSEQSIRELLHSVACREKSIEEAMLALRSLPYADLGTARIDHHRALRRGCPEVIYCAGKTPQQVAQITEQLAAHHPRVLGTRATREHFAAAKELVDDLQYDEPARCLWIDREPERKRRSGVLLIAAGTSDFPVAQEAARTLDFLGHSAKQIYDVGVAGIHRLFDELPQLSSANVIIVVAGMEGALPSVVAGLVAAPVIAVPTSVGYGASFGGISALLGMLNSCASGIGVVNIDNGFGAAYLAASINRQIVREDEGRDE